jgi:agmatinase
VKSKSTKEKVMSTSTSEELTVFTGPATFFGAPKVQLEDVKAGTVAISGAPHESSMVHHWLGTRQGPKGIREASLPLAGKLKNASEGLIDVATGKRIFLPSENRLVDVGDLNVYPPDVMKTTEGISGGVYEVVKRGAFSLVMGGDHYIGYPSCLGFTRAISERNSHVKIGYIHIDTHTDFFEEIPLFGKYNHGTNARRISELEVTVPRNMVWIGLSYWDPAESWRTIKKNGATVFSYKDIHTMGPVEVGRRAGELAIRGCDYIYISLDIDVIDTGFAPGTGAPIIGAVAPSMIFQILDELAKFPIGSMDVVEVAPAIDPSGRTQRIAVEAVLRILGPKIFEYE